MVAARPMIVGRAATIPRAGPPSRPAAPTNGRLQRRCLCWGGPGGNAPGWIQGQSPWPSFRSPDYPDRWGAVTLTLAINLDISGEMEKRAALAALAALAQELRLIFRLLVQAGTEGMPAGHIGEQLGLPSATRVPPQGTQDRAPGDVHTQRQIAISRRPISQHDAAVLPDREVLRRAANPCLPCLPDRTPRPCARNRGTPEPCRSRLFGAPEIKEIVRARYGGWVGEAVDCCAPAASSCAACHARAVDAKARVMGYSDDELAAMPEGANLGLGCGNPQAIAAMEAARRRRSRQRGRLRLLAGRAPGWRDRTRGRS